ncbi:MAG: hypothetical protein A4E48_01090 [Methanosaeta sp. PtaU1.Bin060]|nr:MAG: hypothetical protein A4E48_01090 [Methanosaeta sp. PtaU1.Bin060]
MVKLVISEDARGEELAPLALAINEAIRLPITLRSANFPGVRVEKDEVIESVYSGPVLEEVIRTGKPVQAIPDRGAFKGVPVSVAPIVVEGKVVAAVGVVDVIGTVDIPEVFGAYANVVKEVERKAPERR